MQLDQETLRFLASPVMIIIGSSDSGNRPAIGRGLGVLGRGPGEIDLVFSRWQWPRTAENVAETRRLAVTCSRPSDYVTCQVKGKARLLVAEKEHIARADAYRTDISAVLNGLGVARATIAQWTVPEDLVVARLEVAEAYLQTPGPRAGTAL
ncbi:hypothetical protein [Altericroceibacterium xinjiangense]|uniref:hypothetical protein n=1 Tax=Altericroceibacterium xinjiangense TaxID=762261 RepID=UPI000F7F135F|nr:hypothetical protein [Altericroceibacterium xinjiangense]